MKRIPILQLGWQYHLRLPDDLLNRLPEFVVMTEVESGKFKRMEGASADLQLKLVAVECVLDEFMELKK